MPSYNTAQLIGLLGQAVNDLNHILQGPAGDAVTIGGVVKPTISEAIARHFDELFAMAQGVTGYGTRSALPSLSADEAGVLAWVTNDPAAADNGVYRWTGSAWTRSDYDFLTLLDPLKARLASAVDEIGALNERIAEQPAAGLAFALVDADGRSPSPKPASPGSTDSRSQEP